MHRCVQALLQGVVAITLFVTTEAQLPASEARPNIVFFLADDLGWRME